MAKHYKDQADSIKDFLKRYRNEETASQTSHKHYRDTKDTKVNCEVCALGAIKLYRHRINPNAQFNDDNVIIVCKSCQVIIWKIYKETNASNESEYQLAILLAKLE